MAYSIRKYLTKAGVRYEVRYVKPDGTQTGHRGFKRKLDADRWAAENVTTAKARGVFVDPRAARVTVGALYEQWMAERRNLMKRQTNETTETRWRLYVKPEWGECRLDMVTRAGVQRWVSKLAGEYGYGIVSGAFSILKGVLDTAVRDSRIPFSPANGVRLPKRTPRSERRTYLNADQVIAFAEEAGKSKSNPRMHRALVLTLGFCGLRWGEACGLRVGRVDFKSGRIHVDATIVGVNERFEETPKNHEVRDVPMPRIVSDALREITEGKGVDELVFTAADGKPMRYLNNGERNWWYRAVARAGIPRLSPHGLRHSYASIAVHAGANVKALQHAMGHKDASMTLDVYADLFDSDLDEVAANIDLEIAKHGQNMGTED